MLKSRAYAKLNLGLNITGVRPDGFHELEMVMVPVSLGDDVSLIASEEYSLVSNVILPKENTVYKAIEEARRETGFTGNFTVVLEKRVPSGSGMGAGSADAAAVLRMLRSYFHWNMSDQKLARIGARVGADVPFCVYGKPAVVKGIGEKVEPFSIRPGWKALVLFPEKGVSTKEAYLQYNEKTADHPDVQKIKEAFVRGDEEALASCMGNSLQYTALRMNRQIGPYIDFLKSRGLPCSMMTGSGSAVFGITRTRTAFLEQAGMEFSRVHPECCIVDVLKSAWQGQQL